jgi:hypothetical protein
MFSLITFYFVRFMKHLYFILPAILFTFENLSSAQVRAEPHDMYNMQTLSAPSISDDENALPTGSSDKFITPHRVPARIPLVPILGQIGRNNSHISDAGDTTGSDASQRSGSSEDSSDISVAPGAPVAAEAPLPAPVIPAPVVENQAMEDGEGHDDAALAVAAPVVAILPPALAQGNAPNPQADFFARRRINDQRRRAQIRLISTSPSYKSRLMGRSLLSKWQANNPRRSGVSLPLCAWTRTNFPTALLPAGAFSWTENGYQRLYVPGQGVPCKLCGKENINYPYSIIHPYERRFGKLLVGGECMSQATKPLEEALEECGLQK